MNNMLKRLLIKFQVIVMAVAFLTNVPTEAFADSVDSENVTLELMYAWLVDNQLSNGALPMYTAKDGDAVIVPYFSSIATLAILGYSQEQKSMDAVLNYYDWHFSHLNTDSTDGFASIYDYEVVIKDKTVISETSSIDYDSADSYAALFLLTLGKYVEAGGDVEYIIDNEDKVFAIIDFLMSLIDEDGLSRVSDSNLTKYLMDNCEVAAGLQSASTIISKVYLKQYHFFSKDYWDMVKKIIELKKTRNSLIKSLDENMWNTVEQRYEVGIDKHGNVIGSKSGEDFYPDAVAQLFPIVFGATNPKGQRAKDLYNDFCGKYKWEELAHYKNGDSSFYWGIIAYCGAIMGDDIRVDKYITNFNQLVSPNFNYPAYNADIAWVILAGIYE